jgi:hypothetical protein
MSMTVRSLMYEPLAYARGLRLLQISSDDSDEISCTLMPSSLDDKPPFFALSYVWGDPIKIQPIRCNGLAFEATENLVAAIKQLRNRYPETKFWIDAICINQKDLPERAQQVQMMRDIYRSAAQVVVYLGEETEGLGRAMDLFSTLDEKAKEPISNNNTPSLIRHRLPKSHEEVWDHLADFFNRPWFSRIWVVQEVACSSDDPIILCGSSILRWSSIARVAKFMVETALTQATRTWSRSGNALMIQQYKNYPPFIELLLKTSFNFESTDPRDMVFALYGLVHPESAYVLKSPSFLVSYEKSVKDVYRDAMLGCIKHFGSVEPMCNAIASKSSAQFGLPSWVPNWAIPIKERRRGFAAVSFLAGYKAAGGKRAWAGSIENPDVLRIAGKSHGVIDWVAEPFEEDDLAILPYLRRPRTLERLWENVSARLGSSPDVCESFWRTLITNITGEQRPASDNFYPIFLRYWHDTKKYDMRAIEYREKQPHPPPFGDEEAMRSLFTRAAEAEASYPVSIEEFDAMKRYSSVLAKQFPCQNNGTEGPGLRPRMRGALTANPDDPIFQGMGCPHCVVEALHDVRVDIGLMKVQGHSPALAYQDTDPFIREHFRRLAEDDLYLALDHLTHCHTHLRNVLPNRAFFITNDGLMGLGPKDVRPGDEVTVLSGSGVPLILRSTCVSTVLLDQTDDECQHFRAITRYTMIGDAYVHGIMNGEAVGGFDWDNDYEVFDLV